MNDIIKQSESDFDKEFGDYGTQNPKFLNALETEVQFRLNIKAFMKSQMELAYKKGVEDIKKHLQVQCLDYCEQQNGLDHCKNCGLSIDLIDKMK